MESRKHRSDESPFDPSRSAAGRFSRYAPEQEAQSRVPSVRSDSVLRRINEIWGSYPSKKFFEAADTRKRSKAIREIRALGHTPGDIADFVLSMNSLPDPGKTQFSGGYFVSDLINNCPAESFELHTRHLDLPLNGLGFRNTKQIAIHGDVGDMLALGMLSGRIIVHGNAGSAQPASGPDAKVGPIAACNMHGGVLIVEGDVCGVGERMVGGSVFVLGDAFSVGHRMRGGEITVYGDVTGKVSWSRGSTIRLFGQCPHLPRPDDKRVSKTETGRIYAEGALVRGSAVG